MGQLALPPHHTRNQQRNIFKRIMVSFSKQYDKLILIEKQIMTPNFNILSTQSQ